MSHHASPHTERNCRAPLSQITRTTITSHRPDRTDRQPLPAPGRWPTHRCVAAAAARTTGSRGAWWYRQDIWRVVAMVALVTHAAASHQE